jgi:NAD(P)-dependent dehydrogenase (short-subunit alcohol dehydrogenase family)
MSAIKPLALIAGVGPGLGSALAHRFSRGGYTVAVLSRSNGSAATLPDGAISLSADVTSASSLSSAISQLPTSLPVAVAIYNVASRVKKPFLELSLEELESNWATGGRGAFLFAQAVLPLLLKTAQEQTSDGAAPSLIFTGATASKTAYATSAAFAAGKWAQRALAQSLAREFAPRGVHVAHVVIDGPIAGTIAQKFLKDKKEEEFISPEGIAEVYWGLHLQDRRALTWEVDVRTSLESW